jgi:outer membrane biosynthesis protein TonB
MSFIKEILSQMSSLGIPEPDTNDRQQYLHQLLKIVANDDGFPEESWDELSEACQAWYTKQVALHKSGEPLEDPEVSKAKKPKKKRAKKKAADEAPAAKEPEKVAKKKPEKVAKKKPEKVAKKKPEKVAKKKAAPEPKAKKAAKKAAKKVPPAEKPPRKRRPRSGVVKRGKQYHFLTAFAKDKRALDHEQLLEKLRAAGHDMSPKSAMAMWYNARMLTTILRDQGLYEHPSAVKCTQVDAKRRM